MAIAMEGDKAAAMEEAMATIIPTIMLAKVVPTGGKIKEPLLQLIIRYFSQESLSKPRETRKQNLQLN